MDVKRIHMSDIRLQERIFLLQKEQYKRKLSAVLKDCKFNGQGMRELLSEFMEEAC